MALDITGKVGWWGGSVGVAPSQDADALAFITAANITDTTQKSAINTLVTQLKTYGIWTKMKALYPFVGGTAAQHRFNLKDPRAVDAAFYLTFYGGGTHSATGYQPNGNSYADTKLNPSTVLTLNNSHLAYYSRTNTVGINGKVEIGTQILGSTSFFMGLYSYSNKSMVVMYDSTNNYLQNNETTSAVFGIGSRTSSNSLKYYRNGVLQPTTINVSSGNYPNNNIYLAVNGNSSNKYEWSDRESAFASIGDGLTDTEAANFYTAVQTFQTTLGRQVGVPIVADADAQAFLNAAVITNQTQATAINTLVTDLKTANIWTKMKAIYPFVGGTATTHKFNLKDPRDLDAAYRLVFNGGGTHSATGYAGNASNAWANTFLNAQTNLTNSNLHLSFYSRTASPLNAYSGEILVNAPYGSGTSWIALRTNNKTGGGSAYFSAGNDAVNALASNTLSGFFIGSETSNVLRKLYRNGSSIATNTTSDNNPLPSGPITLLGYSAGSNSGNESAFASIGDGLTDAEATAFYNAVQAYQTTLSRNV